MNPIPSSSSSFTNTLLSFSSHGLLLLTMHLLSPSHLLPPIPSLPTLYLALASSFPTSHALPRPSPGGKFSHLPPSNCLYLEEIVPRLLLPSNVPFPPCFRLHFTSWMPAAFGFASLAKTHLRYHLSNSRMGTYELAASLGQPPEIEASSRFTRRRKVIEHVALFQMNGNFTEEQEKDMLDHLYTLQYQMRGIIAVSLGRIINANPDGCTHALLTRFPSVESLNAYYDNPIRLKIINDYIAPYSHSGGDEQVTRKDCCAGSDLRGL